MDSLARQRAATIAVWRADAASRPRGDWAQLGDLSLHTTGIPERHWNGVFVSGPSQPWPEVSSWFADRGMPWGVLVPSELDAGLAPKGKHLLDQPVMLRDLAGLAPVPALELRWDAGDDASDVQAEAFECASEVSRQFVLPKLVNEACAVVVAYQGGVAVATATLVAVDGVAGIYGVGTVASARRRGLGRAVTLAALHEGRRRGCDLAFLNPSDEGYGVYASLGFLDAPPICIFAAPFVDGIAVASS